MKKTRTVSFLTAIAVLILTLSLFPTVSSAAARDPVTLTVSSAVDARGSTVQIGVGITGNKGLNGMQFRVKYDPAMLAVDEDPDATFINKLSEYSVINFGDDYVEFIATDTTPYRLNKTLVTITFELLAVGTSEVYVEMDQSRGDSLYYIDGDSMVDLQYSLVPGTVEATFSPDADFYYSLEAPSVPANEQAHVLLSMHNLPADIYGFSVEINFDPSKLSFVSAAFTGPFLYGRAVCLEEGKARVFAASPVSSPATTDTEMADLCFDVIDPDKAEGSAYDFTISFYNSEPAYTRVDGTTVKFTNIYTAGATLTLSAPTVLPLDLNDDGVVNIDDVSALLDRLSGNQAAIAAGKSADVNDDGAVSIDDVSALLDALSQ